MVRLFDVLPTVDRLYDGSAARALEPVRVIPPPVPEPEPEPQAAIMAQTIPSRRNQHMALLTGVLVGGLLVTAMQFVRVEVDRPDAWVALTVIKPEEAEAVPAAERGTMEKLLVGCVQGATKGALTSALPAAELATTGMISSVSAVVVATATGLGCVIGAAGDTAKDAARWSLDNAPGFVQRWFNWHAV